MGYRLRLGKIPKSAKEKYAHLKSADEWDDTNEDAPYRPLDHTELYELGKYVNFADNHTEPFYGFEISDCEFLIMTKDGLKHIIEEYRKNTFEMYDELYKVALEGKLESEDAMYEKKSIITHLRIKVDEWEGKYMRPYRLDEDEPDGEIVSSWRIEYAIFNLVYIYRTFDWEKDYLIYSGW